MFFSLDSYLPPSNDDPFNHPTKKRLRKTQRQQKRKAQRIARRLNRQ